MGELMTTETETPLAWIANFMAAYQHRIYHRKAFFDARRTLCNRRDLVQSNVTLEEAARRKWRLCKNCAKKLPKTP